MIITDIHIAKRLLEANALVAIPTETVYGLAANGFSGEAIAKIYQAKNRPSFNPLILHSNSFERFASWGISLPPQALKLAVMFSPGPITFVVKKSEQIPDLVTAGHSTVAIRVPNHPLTLQLLADLDFPLAAPSANKSGSISPTTAQHVEVQFGDEIGAVLDGGPCQIGLESTIISFVDEQARLLRLGGLSIEAIENALGSKVDNTMLINNENPQAPGMLSRHYAPVTPLFLGDPNAYAHENDFAEMAQICFTPAELNTKIPASLAFVLSESGSYSEAAQRLFAVLRAADACGAKKIIATLLPEADLGRAINDRLRRAAVKA